MSQVNDMPRVGDPGGETQVELRARRLANLNRFVQWCRTHPSTWLVSYQRSGRTWLSRLMETASGLNFPDPNNVNYGDYVDFPWYRTHSVGINAIRDKVKHIQVIMLIRDPRDIVLSDAYRQVVRNEHAPTLRVITPEMVGRTTDIIVEQWHERIKMYAHLCTYLVQYEQLCLFPERILTELLDLLKVKPIKPVGEVVRQLDVDSIISVDPKTGKLSQPRMSKVVYKDDYSRYLHHCLKWTRNTMFMKRHNDKIWAGLGDAMTTYGYTYTGHDLKKWGILNV